MKAWNAAISAALKKIAEERDTTYRSPATAEDAYDAVLDLVEVPTEKTPC